MSHAPHPNGCVYLRCHCQPWDKRIARAFLTALGSTFLYRYALSLAGRQAAKLIPVYGQSAGAAAAASISFASTYAIGRAAGLYLFDRQHDRPVEPEALREAFRQAFSEHRGRAAAKADSDSAGKDNRSCEEHDS